MQVAAVQFKASKGDVSGSLERLARLCDEAAPGSALVVCPEMAATGYHFPTRDAALAVSEAAEGPTFERLAPIARRHGSWLVCGFPERDGARLFNAALVIDPTGALAFCYRKTLLFEADESWAEPGDSGYVLVETPAGSFGVGICMDLNDGAFTGWVAAARPRVVAFPTNWLDEGIDIHPYWAWRLREAGCALVAANTWGSDGPMSFLGTSCVMDRGRVLGAAAATGDEIVRATL